MIWLETSVVHNLKILQNVTEQTTRQLVKDTHQLAAAVVFSLRISLVAQFDSVFVLPVLERRPTVNISVIGSVSTNGNSWCPKAEHKSLKRII